jgi:hypothetical protein
MKLFVFKNSKIGEDNGISHGETELINMVNMFIQVCIVNYGLMHQNNVINSQITH